METSEWLPPAITISATVAMVIVARFSLRRNARGAPETAFRVQAWTISLLLGGLIATLFTLPQRGNQELLLGVLGLVVTASIALSSQSIISDGMAGLMLRVVSDFKHGDFIKVGGHIGRVSEMTLLHTEIQTPDRDLTTIPNSLMMTQPVKVVRSSGTIVSATVSLGYDISHHWLEPLFVAATAEAGLEDGFMQVAELGNSAVSYRVAGFLSDPSY